MPDIEPIHPSSGWRSASPYSPAVRAGGFLFVSGHVPVDPLTGFTVGEDIRAQTRQTLDNIRRTLEAAGVGPDRIVKTTVFLTNIADFAAMNAVYREFFAGALPARSTVEVSALGRPEFRVEIEAVALVGEPGT